MLPPRLEAALPFSSKMVGVDLGGGEHVDLHVLDHGDPYGRPVLFLHGNRSWSVTWRHVLRLRASGSRYRLLAADLPGFGLSGSLPPRRRTLDGYGESVAHLVSALELEDPLVVVHEAALAIFDKIEATADNQTTARSHLLMKLKYALDKHAHQEENVIYPALREANSAHDADALNSEHGYIKTYLYELETMPNDSPDWLARVRDFRSMIQEHMRMEEDEVFPKFRNTLTEEQNAKLTAMMNKEGMKMA